MDNDGQQTNKTNKTYSASDGDKYYGEKGGRRKALRACVLCYSGCSGRLHSKVTAKELLKRGLEQY